jgi:hypothetical protein
MKNYIPRCLMVLNDQIQKDPVLVQCMRLAFDWANQAGLDGKRVCELTLVEPDPENYSPLRQQSALWCKIECTDEERKAWDAQRELDVIHAVRQAFKDDE